jgi:hypothetical protein
MPHSLSALRLALAVAATAGLAACGGSREVVAVCPDSGIIHGLDRLHGENAAGNAVSVTMENIDGVCTYAGNRLSLEMSVDLVVDAPPGTSIPYFVVIADPAGELLDKASFVATVPADAPDGAIRLRENLVQEIDGVTSGTSAGYSVLFGLDLPTDIAIEQRRTL